MDYTVSIQLFEDKSTKSQELFFDMYQMATALNLKTKNDDIMHINVLRHKLGKVDRPLPMRDGMGISSREYT